MAGLNRLPWRSIGLFAVSLVGGEALGGGLVAATLVGCAGACMVLELHNRRDLVTTRRVVRRSGLFGEHEVVVLLEAIDSIEVRYPRWGQQVDVGDVLVRGGGAGVEFLGVEGPEELAAVIQRQRDAVVTRVRLDTERKRAGATESARAG